MKIKIENLMFYINPTFKKSFKLAITTILIVPCTLFLSTVNAKEFDIKWQPPVLVNPVKITLTKDYKTAFIKSFGACGAGKFYEIKLKLNQDALITFEGTEPLPYPVHVYGGKNVIIKGLDIVPVIQQGNDAGELPNVFDKTYPSNMHPSIPYCGGLRLRPSLNGTHWVEGLHLDMQGFDADGIILNGPATAGTTKVVIQNSLITGIEGSRNIHGDVLQIQTGTLDQLIFENVTMRQASEGVTLSVPINSAHLRNVDYGVDDRYMTDDQWDESIYGHSFALQRLNKEDYTYENIYVNHYNPLNVYWTQIKDRHFTTPENAGKVIKVYGKDVTLEYSSEIQYNKFPAGGAFVLRSDVGKNYNKEVLADTQAPTAPTYVTATNITKNSLLLSWKNSNDNIGVKEYEIFTNNQKNKTVKGNIHSVQLTGLTPNVNYSIKVRAVDVADNKSIFSDPETAVTDSVDAVLVMLSYNAETGGKITGATQQSINKGASGTPVTAFANAGYSFVKWSDGKTTPTRTDSNVNTNKTLTAQFKKDNETTGDNTNNNTETTTEENSEESNGGSFNPLGLLAFGLLALMHRRRVSK